MLVARRRAARAVLGVKTLPFSANEQRCRFCSALSALKRAFPCNGKGVIPNTFLGCHPLSPSSVGNRAARIVTNCSYDQGRKSNFILGGVFVRRTEFSYEGVTDFCRRA